MQRSLATAAQNRSIEIAPAISSHSATHRRQPTQDRCETLATSRRMVQGLSIVTYVNFPYSFSPEHRRIYIEGCIKRYRLFEEATLPTQHPFLSAAWIEEVRALRQQYQGEIGSVDLSLRMNQIVTDLPFQDTELRTYIDTSSGIVDLEVGELENPDVTVMIDYATAKAIFVDLNPQAAIEGFMSGRIKVTGDMTKLLALQSILQPSDASMSVTKQIQEITE